MSEQYRFRFSPKISNSQIETRLLLAGINTENVFGESAMRLDASFCFDPATLVCEIDAGTEIGRHVAKLFVAYISKEFGDAAYEVERRAGDDGILTAQSADLPRQTPPRCEPRILHDTFLTVRKAPFPKVFCFRRKKSPKKSRITLNDPH